MGRRRNRRAELAPWLTLGSALSLALVAACADGRSDGAAVLDGLLAGGRLTLPLAELGERAALAPDQDFRVERIGGDAHTSHHVVAIRDRESLHRHDHHDLLVVILSGHGRMRLGAEVRPVGRGSILYVPRATPHAFQNAADDPAVAYAVYAPPFDGRDRVEVTAPGEDSD